MLSLQTMENEQSNNPEKHRLGGFWKLVLIASIIVIVVAEIILVYQLHHNMAAALLCITVPILAYCLGRLHR
jgi:hypothetical protein